MVTLLVNFDSLYPSQGICDDFIYRNLIFSEYYSQFTPKRDLYHEVYILAGANDISSTQELFTSSSIEQASF